MSPNGGGDPSGALGAAVERELGGADALRKEMTAAGIGRFGSGFAWLIVQDKKLKVVSTPNQDNPLMKKVVDDSIRGRPGFGFGCLGACLLLALSKPPPGLHQGILECSRLANRRQPLRRKQCQHNPPSP